MFFNNWREQRRQAAQIRKQEEIAAAERRGFSHAMTEFFMDGVPAESIIAWAESESPFYTLGARDTGYSQGQMEAMRVLLRFFEAVDPKQCLDIDNIQPKGCDGCPARKTAEAGGGPTTEEGNPSIGKRVIRLRR